MTSMTGFAYREYTGDNIFVSVEIKSYNSKYLDLNVNLPSMISRLENFFRDKVAKTILRGKVEVYIRLREDEPPTDVVVNKEAVKSYAKAMKIVEETLGRNDEEIPLSLIVRQEGVLTACRDYDVDYYKNLIEPVFDGALADFVADRMREGENLKKDLTEKITQLEEAANFFALWQPKMEVAFKDSVTTRFRELLGEGYDQQRVLTEIAALLVKYTINEEIVRLKSHLKALKAEIAENPIPGRKIDFICQEINREINTIVSKNQFTEVGAMVVTANNALEKIREQARNVE